MSNANQELEEEHGLEYWRGLGWNSVVFSIYIEGHNVFDG